MSSMRYSAARAHALGLPEVAEAPHFNYNSFRVRGKIFTTVPPGEEHLHVFVADEHRDPACLANPEWIEKLWWGKKVVGLRVELAKADPSLVKRLLELAWENKAPKALRASRASA